MNQATLEAQLADQIRDGVEGLPLRQKVLLLRLVRRIQEDDDNEAWAWALCLDAAEGGNGNVTG